MINPVEVMNHLVERGVNHIKTILLEDKKPTLTTFYHFVSSEGRNEVILPQWNDAWKRNYAWLQYGPLRNRWILAWR